MKNSSLYLALFFTFIFVGCASKERRDADVEKIIKAYKDQKGQVKECYESALKIAPEMAGEVTLRWIVDRKGELKSAKIQSSTLGNDGLHECILNHLKAVQFPGFRSVSTIEVEYTLSFSK